MTTNDASKSQEHITQTQVPPQTPSPSGDHIAHALRGFGPLGVLSIVLILLSNALLAPLGAVLVLFWVHRSHTPWPAIGYVRPRSWIGSAAVGITFGVAFKILLKTIVMPLLGADPVNQAYHYLVGNTAALPGAIFMMFVVAGFGEETVFRGFLFERLGKLLGHGVWAKTLTVLAVTVLFASEHYPEQGIAGMEQAMFTGSVFGAIFAVTGSIFMVMCAHVAFDLAAVAIIYLDIESTVAHLIFK